MLKHEEEMSARDTKVALLKAPIAGTGEQPTKQC